MADRAGVSAPLVLKYFGNKDALFARVMSFESDADALLDAPLEELGRHMVRHLLEGQTQRGADPVLRIVFAPSRGSRARYCGPTSVPRSATGWPGASAERTRACAPNSR